MPKRTRGEAAVDKAETALALGTIGGQVAGPIGAGVGAVTGLIVGDQGYVFPLDMVAIPAFEAYKIQGGASFMVYIKQGETLVPTGGEVLDASPLSIEEQENLALMSLPQSGGKTSKKKRKSPYKKAYSSAFDSIKAVYMKKDGTWKKGGFKRAVSAAHKKAKAEMNKKKK